MKYLLSLTAFFLVLLNLTAEACTSIIISGKSTPREGQGKTES
jgi:hypothetical protein